ncbi:glycoside hydrolase family 3 C-terminal domain-containing protein [Lachnoclostridium sp. Marseille-P6806]|uniref:glycoside hydrolase family 3 C-terminal domain-containing protein n=1 Tax=Lachnoclostridium sp. Marseille-P6806 TaxID=2364793 RepID=UPI001032540D|nr:glycoside hydrolase family 3 C-terminal domain-containing protein [Lachnoclostridium sp. Marseille-P6806]
MADIKALIAQMTLEEKAGLCSGADFWHTKAVERLEIPSVMVSDGPHGLRKQAEGGDHLGINDSIVSVCFPAGCATAASFDRALVREMGGTIGNECQAEKVSVVLGPAVNIKRSPLCGRNFEYLSEDPYLAGEMAASYISGVQEKHVGTSIKHFALNNQEHERMSGSSEADERTIREIYLPAFETAVKKSQPKTIMNSYNRINGVFAAENHRLLTEILRDEWGFEGYVVSDWGATNDRVKGMEAGEDLEMPGGNFANDALIVRAVREGRLPESTLDEAVRRILTVVYDYAENVSPDAVFDRERDHAKAVDIAAQCMVLLKNENGVLPLSAHAAGCGNPDGPILFVGEFAEKPRFQGGGSSHINCYQITDALREARKRTDVQYAKGFPADGDVSREEDFAEAEALAKGASRVVVFAGLPDSFESEGYDRSSMKLPACQDALIERLAAVNPNLIVVLHNGSPVEMPWADRVSAILEAYLGGEGSGEAVVRILFGEENPSGKLAETFPLRLEDTPCYLNFPGKGGKVFYREGVFVGYRYYDSRRMEVLFPFGHGLSYTSFRIGAPVLSASDIRDTDTVRVTVEVTNTGTVFGREVVQLYVRDLTGTEIRPDKELKGFAKIALAPGETGTVSMELDKRSFAFYSEEIGDWYAPTGEYEILVGNSSRNIAGTAKLHVTSTNAPRFAVHANTMLGELMQHPETAEILKTTLLSHMALLAPQEKDENGRDQAVSEDMGMAMMRYMPIRALRSFGSLTDENVEEIVAALNRALGN